ncbi:XrtA/PEP-CTERM system amidotransferase [Sphingomonas crocodyli]|uniref:asparagine synthase (glutamine-hydrolyzing) n=1 Tax=Sphingomonas crocodyli TaxID=1979270 RepID=A0A437M7S4_9SPHN|nr:XrtA/PEP-CTERM system amidotransferase [Sphingomonas crocodyli]RVT93781.1 amidotransferase 1, exosortase A system-associated [Sphingomonas crocodyli]
MCGIAGIFHLQVAKPVEEARVRAMADAIAHRGPDGSGIWTAPGVGFGHRRLSIIDLEGGVQPMPSADGRHVIIFNGEIYNYREVRAELTALGVEFRTHSDTEVILEAYRRWGPKSLDRLNGMFAFAIHDTADASLFIARDRLGVKPLFYAELSDGSVIFGSELKALTAHPLLRRTPELSAIDDYLAFGYVPDDTSLLQGVRKLPAGHHLTLRRGHPLPAPVRWWDVSFADRAKGSARDLEAELVDLMRKAVTARMIADVPLGAFLSGGVDSSAVVALMAEESREAVKTCSIGFDHPDYDETRYAGEIAARFATDHRVRIVSADDYGLADTLADHFDEPFADASALPTYRVSQLARETVTVALSGDGADEAFAGYRRLTFFNAEDCVRRLLPQGFRTNVFGTLGRLYPKMDWAPQKLRAKSTFQALGRSEGEAYAEAVGVTPMALRHRLYTDQMRSSLNGHRAEDRYIKAMAAAPARDGLDRAQYADMQIWLPGDILTKVDRTSMAVSLEAREPLLDYRLIEFAARLPVSMRVRGTTGKWLMKQAMRRYLPDDILFRKKMGFVTPISAWFRGPLAEEAGRIAQGSMLAQTGWFDPAALDRIVRDHRSGLSDHGRLLWQLMMLDKSLGRLFG